MFKRILSCLLLFVFVFNILLPIPAFCALPPMPNCSLYPCENKYTDYVSVEYSGYWLHEKGRYDNDTKFILAAYLLYAVAMDAYFRDDAGVSFGVNFGDIENSLGYPRTKFVHGMSFDYVYLADPAPSKPTLATYRALMYGQQMQYNSYLNFAKSNFYKPLCDLGSEIIGSLFVVDSEGTTLYEPSDDSYGVYGAKSSECKMYSMEFMPLFKKAFQCLSETPYISGPSNPNNLSYYQREGNIKVKAVYNLSEYLQLTPLFSHHEYGYSYSVINAYAKDGAWQFCFHRDLCCFEFISNFLVPSSFCADMITVDYIPKFKSYLATGIVPAVDDKGGYDFKIDKSNKPPDKPDTKDDSGLIAKIKSLFGAIKDKASQILSSLKDGINPKLESIKKALSNIKDGIKSALSAPFTALNKKLDGISDKINGFFDVTQFSLDLGPLKTLGNTIKDKFPFCIPFDFYKSIKALNASPSLTLNINIDNDFFQLHHTIDFSPFEFLLRFARFVMITIYVGFLIVRTRDLMQ